MNAPERALSPKESEIKIKLLMTTAHRAGHRVTPVFCDGKTKPFSKDQSYPDRSDYNGAIAVGLILDNCVLLDWDGNKGEALPLPQLAAALDLDEMPPVLQSNDSGTSLHWLFRLPDRLTVGDQLKHSHDNWQPFIDIKAGNQLMHLKPHKTIEFSSEKNTAAFPTRAQLPLAPQALIDALTKATYHAAPSTPSTTWDGSPTLIQDTEFLLRHINPNLPYDQWAKILMGIHDSFGNNETALTLADDWSRQGENYSGRELIAEKLGTFTEAGGVTMGTLRHIAKQGGADLAQLRYQEPTEPWEATDTKHALTNAERSDQKPLVLSEEPTDQGLPIEINEANYKTELPERYVYLQQSSDFWDWETFTTIPKVSLSGTYAHIKHKKDDDKLVPIDAAKVVLQSIYKESAHSLGWFPKADKFLTYDKSQHVNTYRGPAIPRKAGEPTLWLDLMHHVYGEQTQLALSHMAFTVQRPDEKIRWQILVVSNKKRTGKTSSIKPLTIIYPKEHSTLSPEDVETGWGDMMISKKVIIIEELYRPNSRAFFNSIKAQLVNDATEQLNMKGGNIVTQQNLRAYYLFTNHWNSIQFDPDEDKLLVVEGPKTPWGDEAKFTEYFHALKHGDLAGQVLGYLQDFDLTDFQYQSLPVRTKALERLCRESAPDYAHHLQDSYEDAVIPFESPCVPFEDIRRHLNQENYKGGNNGVKSALTNLGMEARRISQETKGQRLRYRLWVPTELIAITSNAELINISKKRYSDINPEALAWLHKNGWGDSDATS